MLNLRHGFDIYVKTLRKISQIFMAFSEKLNLHRSVVPQNELSKNNFCLIYSPLTGSLKAFAKIGPAEEAI